MYSIYVTNKGNYKVYIRLHREKISSVNPSFHDDLTKSKDDPSYIFLRCGFREIPPYETIPFTVDVARNETRMYASLCSRSNLDPRPEMWIMDFELNCLMYGCLFIHSKERSIKQANPEPVWIPVKKGEDEFSLPKVIKAGSEARSEVYLGRGSTGEGSTPCKIIFNGNCKQICCIMDTIVYDFDCGELLKDTGHKFVRGKTGDPMPPHAVVAGVSVPEGSLYLGRVGGNTPCSITTENGRIKSFCYGPNKVQNGEILLLTDDPKIYRY